MGGRHTRLTTTKPPPCAPLRALCGGLLLGLLAGLPALASPASEPEAVEVSQVDGDVPLDHWHPAYLPKAEFEDEDGGDQEPTPVPVVTIEDVDYDPPEVGPRDRHP